ncbi:cytosine deaminase [uncultured Microbulbifer sp.]|uniref:cytosine deaminase n=1 Tax=uncultured Microbulbifer sp. TaxID=348147 RepID=UPI00262302A1|nr:cytosine deaminase [uncultured Microbulbifer sp.]
MQADWGAGFKGTGIIRKARVPACVLRDPGNSDPSDLVSCDLLFRDGTLIQIAPAASLPAEAGGLDLDNGLVLPVFADLHTHLDKGHIWPRKPNPDGSFMGALQAAGKDRTKHWSREDVRARMEFGLRCAYAHGTAVIRTHLDSVPPQDEITWPLFCEIRDEWAGRVELQGVCLFGIDHLATDNAYLGRIAARVQAAGGLLGTATYMVPDLDLHLEAVFRAAMDHALDLDFHVDETLDPSAVSLRHIAETALRLGFQGKIVCGHCCALSVQPDDEVARTLDLVAKAGIAVAALPMCNLYLLDRALGRTPRRRGVTLLHEMRARGIDVVVASDNTRDPFCPYGDLDLIETYTQATRILHLDHPIGDWIRSITTTPAHIMGISASWIGAGEPADLVLFRARNWNELLSRPGGPRRVLRAGVSIDKALPDYRELDDYMHIGGQRP